MRSTRALWDPTYVDESWIGEPVRLIPRMRDWVANDYPGTKLAITEYHWGGVEHVNGALAHADVLGIFGREGLDLATMWAPPTASQPAAYAFRMYRNYDGTHGRFGDVSVSATSGDQAQLAVYAAERAADGALTVMVINKTGTALTTDVTVTSFPAAGTGGRWRYGTAAPTAIVHEADVAVAGGVVHATYPASSITLLVLARSGAAPTATRTATPTRTAATTPTPTATLVPTGSGTVATPTPARTPGASSIAGTIRQFRSGDPVAGVTVALAGVGGAATVTDADGHYLFAGLSDASWEVVPQAGAPDAPAVGAADAAAALRIVKRLRSPSAFEAVACDAAGDGKISARDAKQLLARAVGLAPELSAVVRCGSPWLFVPTPSVVPQQTVTLPVLSRSTCSPGAVSLAALGGAVGGQDFTAVLLGDCAGDWRAAGPLGMPGATVTLGTPVLSASRMRVPLVVTAPTSYASVDAVVSFDPAAYPRVKVRRVENGRRAVIAVNAAEAGRLAVALAGAQPMASGTVAVVELRLGTDGPLPAVTLASAIVGP